MDDIIKNSHSVILEDRKKLSLTGIKDVLSFDDETILLESNLGKVTIKGSGLHIINFNTETGDMSAEGKLYALAYTSDKNSQGGFMSRLFK